MGGSCCGGGCGDKKPEHLYKGRSGIGLLWVVAIAALVGIVALSAIALGQPVAQPPKTPPSPAQATPAAPEPMKGVIRHGRAEPIAKPATPGMSVVRIATYNIENFFDKDSSATGTGSMTPAKPAAHRKAAADAIRKINADVIALEEVESKETITNFRDEYLADMGYTHIASIDAGDSRGIEQSILSRFPVKDELNWPRIPLAGAHPDKLGNKPNPEAGKPLVLHRSPMRATVVVPADPTSKDAKPFEITLFAVHHKSGPYYGYERIAEAEKTLELVHDFEKQHSGASVIVLGDFNARATEKSFQVYTSGGMTDAMTGVPGGVESKEFTSHSSGRTIDHILVNAPAAAMVSLDTRFVLGTMQRPEGVDWRKTPPPSGYASDHYPVVVDLVLRVNPESAVHRGTSVETTKAPLNPIERAVAPGSTPSDKK